ncbi:MAG TPA: DUF4166 domain-containing protein, partial [Gammaproteobacteria bacterium]|nr:DUF4166 domain-containing protein [Gammaproteobacteria bacterium]
ADLWPEVRDVWLGAGPVPAILHRLLRALAKAVARGWIPSLVPLTPLMFHAVNRLRWGEDRGGMFVEVKGRNARGKRETHSWHLLAEGSDGPWIPSMAIAAIVRKRLAGLVPLPGARAAAAELELGDYQPFFDARRIHWGERGQGEAEDRWLYQRLLGDAYSSLPAALKTVHGTSAESTLHGKAAITRGKGLAARLAARVIGLPRAADDLSATVTFERTPIQEQWTRDFGGQTFRSRLFEGQGRFERLLCERFGPFVFAMAPVVDGHRLRLVMRGWSVLGLPLPRALAPRGDIVESEEGGRFHFHVEITLPFIGLVVRYAGFLETEPSSEPVSTSAGAEHNLNGCE